LRNLEIVAAIGEAARSGVVVSTTSPEKKAQPS
jgi:hypothetical protein